MLELLLRGRVCFYINWKCFRICESSGCWVSSATGGRGEGQAELQMAFFDTVGQLLKRRECGFGRAIQYFEQCFGGPRWNPFALFPIADCVE